VHAYTCEDELQAYVYRLRNGEYANLGREVNTDRKLPC